MTLIPEKEEKEEEKNLLDAYTRSTSLGETDQVPVKSDALFLRFDPSLGNELLRVREYLWILLYKIRRLADRCLPCFVSYDIWYLKIMGNEHTPAGICQPL